MFVMTAKLSKPRLIAAGVLILAVVILVVALVSGGGGGSADAPDGTTNDARLAYLAGFGWSVNGTPKQTQQVRIPKSADDRVFSRYNALQKSQGFDLTAHAGKEATRYVYEILNYPDASAPVYASVLVLDGHIIGGDITSLFRSNSPCSIAIKVVSQVSQLAFAGCETCFRSTPK